MSEFYIVQSLSNDCVIDIEGGATNPPTGTKLDAFTLYKPYHHNQLWTLVDVGGGTVRIQSYLRDPAGHALFITIPDAGSGVVSKFGL